MEKMLGRIEKYWTNRAEGYSNINKWELSSDPKENWFNALMAEFPNKAPEDVNVLDIGCGPGFFSIILAQAGYNVTASDYTPEMLEKAKENAGDLADFITWTRQDAQALTLPDNTFDVVVSRNVTWNLENPKKAYAEWKRVLKNGGIILNFDANWYSYLYSDDKRRGYEKDLSTAKLYRPKNQYDGVNTDEIESIARCIPLSPEDRPAWDKQVLKSLGFSSVRTDKNIWQKVWNDTEQRNYASTPMFLIKAVK